MFEALPVLGDDCPGEMGPQGPLTKAAACTGSKAGSRVLCLRAGPSHYTCGPTGPSQAWNQEVLGVRGSAGSEKLKYSQGKNS